MHTIESSKAESAQLYIGVGRDEDVAACMGRYILQIQALNSMITEGGDKATSKGVVKNLQIGRRWT
jgi:hypothetical protein